MYFYSNQNEKDQSDQVGPILSEFKAENPDTVMIYSFDADMNSTLMEQLRENYSITQVPVIISPKGNQLFIKNINDLEPYLVNNSLQ